MTALLVYYFKLWDYLTQAEYRVKIKKYSDGKEYFYPQRKYRLIPMWFCMVEDPIYGSVHRYMFESSAWEMIRSEIKYKPIRLERVEVKYTE